MRVRKKKKEVGKDERKLDRKGWHKGREATIYGREEREDGEGRGIV